MDSGKQLSVKLDNLQAVYLLRLARESGRSQGQVIQRLIIHAISSPETLKVLGVWNWQANQPKDLKP